jgi:hypothetical protein
MKKLNSLLKNNSSTKKRVVRKKAAKKKVGNVLQSIKRKTTQAKKNIAYNVIDKTAKGANKTEKAALNKAKKTIKNTYIGAIKKKSATKKKVGALPKSPSLIAQYSNSIAQINAAQKTLDEIALRMKLRPHPAMKLQMKDTQIKLKKYIREQKTHARELKKLI